MRNDMRRKYQKGLTKLLREANKKLKDDDYWLGRFYVLQRKSYWEEFSDGSGGILHAYVRVYDHVTGYYRDFIYDYAPYFHALRWHLYMDILNTFIVEDLQASIRDEKIDCRKLPYIKNDRRPNNYYLDYEHWRNTYETN